MAEVIPEKTIKELDFIFNNKVIKLCFDNNMWIAGGFARKIGHILLGLKKESISTRESIINYLNEGSDIDFFCENSCIVNNISRDIIRKKLRPWDSVEGGYGRSTHDSPFAKNIQTRHLTGTTTRHFIDMKGDSHNIDKKYLNAYCMISIQMVTKFCFKNIKKCFDSFDLTNCKYAIAKKNNHYVLRYDKSALAYDSLNELHLSHSNSPYTISRITKYLRKKDLNHMSKRKDSIDEFKRMLYKLLVGDWDDIYNVMNKETFKHHVISLNKVKEISVEDLSMFIGDITNNIVENKSFTSLGGYGVYAQQVWRKVDWASHEINSRI
jgi:hypothetical protein